MAWIQHLNESVIFLMEISERTYQSFKEKARYKGPGALVLEKRMQNTPTSISKDEVYWETVSEIQYLWGPAYTQILSEYTPSQEIAYVIIGISVNDTRTISRLYRITRNNGYFFVEPVTEDEKRPRTGTRLLDIWNLL